MQLLAAVSIYFISKSCKSFAVTRDIVNEEALYKAPYSLLVTRSNALKIKKSLHHDLWLNSHRKFQLVTRFIDSILRARRQIHDSIIG